MTSHDNQSHDEAEFALFLNRQGPLARQLQSLDHPEPSAALDAAILANAQRALDNARSSRPASPDVIVPRAKALWLSFLRHWQMPAGLAASLIVAVLAVRQWQGGTEAPLQVAQAPQSSVAINEPAPAASAAPVPSMEAARPARPAPIKRDPNQLRPTAPAAPPLPMIAQADIPEQADRVLRSAAPASASADGPTAMPAPAPHNDSQAHASARALPKPWLELIDELLKADLRRDAQEEWKQFRKSYPNYPVPDKLKQALDRPADK